MRRRERERSVKIFKGKERERRDEREMEEGMCVSCASRERMQNEQDMLQRW